jgi:tetratricopeptide (TPR) repeat protein
MLHRVGRFTAVVFALSLASAPANGQDSSFVLGLRQRRLFDLAERYCREQLARPQINDLQKGELTQELIRTLALHAANSPNAEREARWQAARDLAAQFLREQPRHPRRALIELQDALTVLLQGELLQQEIGESPDGVATKALPPLREAIRLLADLDKRLAADIVNLRREPLAADAPSAGELINLQQQVQRQQARALRTLGLCYPEKNENRISLLLQAADLLKKSFTKLSADDPRLPPLQLELAIVYRFLRQPAEAEPFLDALVGSGVPPDLQAQAVAERARWRLQAGDAAAAWSILEARKDGPSVAEFDFAKLEVATAQWRKALEEKDQQAEKLQKRCLELARLLEEAHGDAWGRRANQWLVYHAPRGASAGAELLGKAADRLYLQGQLNEAIAAYDDAVRQAIDSQDDALAFELGYKAALVEQQRKAHTAAAERLRKLSLDFKALPTAPQAHRQAAWNLAQALRTHAASTEEYSSALAEHLKTWPRGEAANQVRVWMGRLRESQQAWEQGLAIYRDVPRSSPHFADALSGAIRSSEHYLAELQASGAPTDVASREAIAYYQRAITGNNDQLPQNWSEVDGQAALAAARVVLGYRTSGYDGAELLLEAALAGLPDAPETWKQEAQSLLVAALAVQPGKRAAAEKTLTSLGAAMPQTLLRLLDMLTLIARRSQPGAAREIAALQLQTVEQLGPQAAKLGGNTQARLERVRAECLVSTGKLDEAVILYTRLAQAHPQDGDIQEGYAALLSARTDKASLEKGLTQWRRVAAKSPPRTQRWWRAKYGVAETQFKLGDKSEAIKLIRYLAEVPPGLEGCDLKDQFMALLKRCGA